MVNSLLTGDLKQLHIPYNHMVNKIYTKIKMHIYTYTYTYIILVFRELQFKGV